MKRIGLFLGICPHAGGMFQYSQSLLNALQKLPKMKYTVVVAYVGENWGSILANHPFPARYITGGKFGLLLANAFVAARSPAWLVRTASSLLNPISWHLRELACDLWIFPAQDALGYQLRVRALVTIHDLMHRYEPHFPEVIQNGRYRIREHRFRNLAQHSIGVLVDSEVGRRHVIESYGTQPEKIFPLPYVANHCAGVTLSKTELKAKYRLPEKFLFYPAQFWAHKNHATLLRATASVKSKCPDLHLVFTGALQREYQNLVALTTELGMTEAVTFCGYILDSDLPSFYQQAYAMIMPTFFGPTNIPPLEAILYSCPMAVSGIYGMPEQLGDAALYFDPRSEASIAQAIAQLWKNDEIRQILRRNMAKRMTMWNEDMFAHRLRLVLDQQQLNRPGF